VNTTQHPTDFWRTLARSKKPIVVLAPMADVTDAAFRRLIVKHGKPDVTWTEFVSADGLCSPGREVLLNDLMYTEAERPIVAQLFTSNVEHMRKAATLVRELGFDGIDINMGCPDRSIEKQGAGAAMIKNPTRAREIIRAAKEGATGDASKGERTIPVSVKTRIGYNKNELDSWLPEILAEDPAVVTIHARTRKEMSKVPARWEEVKRAVEIRNALPAGSPGSSTLIFGNGDVMSVADAQQKALDTGCDGVMLGRAIFGNPWLFSGRDHATISIKERLETMVEHTKLFEELLGGVKNFAIMKKHYKAYVHGWEGAKEFRMTLMEAKDATEIEKMVKEHIAENGL
jgi:nifR3 family TIM-barrel protein